MTYMFSELWLTKRLKVGVEESFNWITAPEEETCIFNPG